ncbi:MAG: flagellar protein FliS [Defluviitaleaceae bacterium]|nr:flagellar protein FliS [Defluviitaleaceae bacterium]
MDNTNYTAKISNADPLGLVIITYELILTNIAEALEGGDPANIKKSLNKSRQFLADLISALDMSHEISKSLMSVYIYANKLLIESELKASGGRFSEMKKPLTEASTILSDLLKSWKTLEADENIAKGEKIMPDALKVYAGLTYKGGKLEEFVDYDEKRGYKA